MSKEEDQIFRNTQRIHANVSTNSTTIIGWTLVFHAAACAGLYTVATNEFINREIWLRFLGLASLVPIAFFGVSFRQNEKQANDYPVNVGYRPKESWRWKGHGKSGWAYLFSLVFIPLIGWIAIALFGCFLEIIKKRMSFDISSVRSYAFDLENHNHLKVPYFAEFKKDQKLLLYIASQHISAKEYPDLLKHPTWKTIQTLMRDYHPQIAIIEGIDPREELHSKSFLEYADKCEATNYLGGCGESFFVINQARKSGVDYITGEPAEQFIKRQIQKEGFADEDLLGFYLVRQIPQLKRQEKFDVKEFPKVADQLLMQFKMKILSDVRFDFDDFKSWYSAHMSRPKSFLDIENDDPAPNGGADSTYIQRISNKVGLIRDRHIVATIEKMLSKFDRVMIVYGGSHLLTQEKALIEAMGIPKYSKVF